MSFAIVQGSEYIENNLWQATSVFSSRVLWLKIVHISILNGSSVDLLRGKSSIIFFAICITILRSVLHTSFDYCTMIKGGAKIVQTIPIL